MQLIFACAYCGVRTEAHHTRRSRLCCRCNRKRDDERRHAHSTVRRAVMAGKLQPVREQSCVDCGQPATDYDHRDYTQPLVVEPVCRSCNLRRPLAFDSKYRPQPLAA